MSNDVGEFQTDAENRIIARAVTGWTIAGVDGMAVLCKVEYVQNQQELESERHSHIQLLLTPEQALELAKILSAQAERVQVKAAAIPVV